MNVDIALLEKCRVESEFGGATLHQGHRGLRAFAHDVAKLACEK